MALVSETCVKEWFKKDSWVYKNFAYLFHNPLWDKNVPSGFSLCPYFWLAMISLFVMRPIIVPVCLGVGLLIKGLMKIGGVPFRLLDEKIIKKAKRIRIFPEGMLKKAGMGIGILMLAIVAIIVVVALLLLLFLAFQKIWVTSHFGFTMTIWGLTNIVTLFVCMWYIIDNQYKTNRCKVEWYILVCFLASTILLSCIYPGQVWHGISTALSAI